MTTIIGVKYADGIVIASDSQASIILGAKLSDSIFGLY
jgi:20S proteasome alpha/beta subunit